MGLGEDFELRHREDLIHATWVSIKLFFLFMAVFILSIVLLIFVSTNAWLNGLVLAMIILTGITFGLSFFVMCMYFAAVVRELLEVKNK